VTFSKLGTDTETHQTVYIPKPSRSQGLYIIGIQGTGKSGLIENLIMQDIDQQIGVCVLDPHGELIDHVLARLEPKNEKDVILLDISDEDYPFGLNLFTCSNLNSAKAVQGVVDQVMHVFDKLLGVSHDTPLILQYLRNCTYTLIANPGYTMAEIPLLLTDKNCRQQLVANVKKLETLTFWRDYDAMPPSEQRIERSSILRRVEEFLQDLTKPIVGQSKTTTDLQKIMNEGKILLVKLSAQVDSVSSLIGSLMIALILNAAYNRPSQRRQFHLYADEFQRFATEDFATLLEEARKFGIATTIAHQNRGQLNSANSKLETDLKDRSRSVGNLVVFKINSKDADDLAGEFDITPQAAWEEEIEKEWVEVLKPEWYERVEEEVTDGTEPIKTPVREVLTHVQQRGGYPNPALNWLINSWIRKNNKPPAHNIVDAIDLFNDLFYRSMLFGKQQLDPDTIPIPYELVEKVAVYEFGLYCVVCNDEFSKHFPILTTGINYQSLLRILSSHNLEWSLQHEGLILYQKVVNFANSDPDVMKYQFRGLHEQRVNFETFLRDLRAAMRELAKNPIEEPSGLEQPRKRKQINYHTHPPQTITHPRKTIMHPQRPYQDVRNDIANQLSGLPAFTARVKLGTNAPQNPGKTCLSCGLLNTSGARYCTGCNSKLPAPNEYIITTIKPAGGMGTQQLDQRIKRIQARNIQDGYVRERTKVEAEITQRQTQRCGSPPAQPQQPQQPPHRVARQVPVQGKCQNCGASNSPGSKFCNQCGGKL